MRPNNDVVAFKKVQNDSGLMGFDDNVGEVIAVGRGIISGGAVIPLAVQVGDKVVYEGTAIEHEDVLFIRDEQILAVL